MVQIVQCPHELLGNVPYGLLRQALVVLEHFEQFPCTAGRLQRLVRRHQWCAGSVERHEFKLRSGQGSTLSKLGDHAEFVVGFKGVEHLNDVLVLEVAQNLDLLPQAANVLGGLAVFDNELHRRDLSCRLAPPLVNLRSRSHVDSRHAVHGLGHTANRIGGRKSIA